MGTVIDNFTHPWQVDSSFPTRVSIDRGYDGEGEAPVVELWVGDPNADTWDAYQTPIYVDPQVARRIAAALVHEANECERITGQTGAGVARHMHYDAN